MLYKAYTLKYSKTTMDFQLNRPCIHSLMREKAVLLYCFEQVMYFLTLNTLYNTC